MAPRKELAAQLSLSDFIPRLFVFGLPSSRSRVYRKKTNQRTNEILLRVQFRTGYYIARPSATSQQQQQQSAVNLYLCPVWFYRDTESIRPFVYGFQSTIFFSFFLSSSSRLLPMITMGPIYIHTNCGTINCPFSLAYYCASVREG
jgi:hypothetical protein